MPSEPTDPSSDKRPTLFLSYSRNDEAHARRLATALGQAGYTVWWDALIEGGASYARSIGSALEKADAVLVLWSASSIESDWVRDEAAQGRDRHRLVPLSLDGSKPPLGFRQYQVIDVSHWHGRRNSPQFAEIERAIAAALGHEAPVRVGRRSGISRRTMVIGGSAAAAAIAGGGLFLAWDRGLLGLGGEEIESIAVMPFKNLSGDPTQA
ncbi:MAG TPA: toll/interleukin-1 receptor domain-containing protein [Sphingomicrobium sp.]|nr:toll/interleukin-1 receptor domain-containing protein [Sphingomicrobium sp.]